MEACGSDSYRTPTSTCKLVPIRWSKGQANIAKKISKIFDAEIVLLEKKFNKAVVFLDTESQTFLQQWQHVVKFLGHDLSINFVNQKMYIRWSITENLACLTWWFFLIYFLN